MCLCDAAVPVLSGPGFTPANHFCLRTSIVQPSLLFLSPSRDVKKENVTLGSVVNNRKQMWTCLPHTAALGEEWQLCSADSDGIIFTWSGRARWWASLFSDLLIQPLHCSRSVLLSRFSFNPRTVLHCDLENAGISSKPKCRWPLPAGAAQHHQPPAERCARVKQLRKHHTKCPVK